MKGYKHLTDLQVDEIFDLYRSGNSVNKIGGRLKRSPQTVARWVNRGGLMRSRQEAHGMKETTQQQALEMYRTGESSTKVAKFLGVSASAVRVWAQQSGISRANKVFGKDVVDSAVALYLSGKSAKEVGEVFSTSDCSVLRWVRNSGANTRGYSEANAKTAANSLRPVRGIRSRYCSDKGVFVADSLYEAVRIQQLDNDPHVLSFSKVKDLIPYGDGRRYNPDIKIVYSDGRIFVEEVKPEYLSTHDLVLQKVLAATSFYAKQGIGFRLITEQTLGLDAFDSFIPHKVDASKAVKDRLKHAVLTAKSNIRNGKSPR